MHNFLWSLAGTAFNERMLVAGCWIINNTSPFYRHIECFNSNNNKHTRLYTQEGTDEGTKKKNNKEWTFNDYAWEWLCNSAASEVVLASLLLFVEAGKDKGLQAFSLRKELRVFNPLKFCAKLCVVRVVVDLVFWLGHYCIHQKPLYQPIHKLHHEHHHPHVLTNQHFTIVDLFLEV